MLEEELGTVCGPGYVRAVLGGVGEEVRKLEKREEEKEG